MTILDKIKEKKIERLNDARAKISLKEIKSMALDTVTPKDFKSSIKKADSQTVKLIAEIKKASPSKGIISEQFNHIEIANIYEDTPVSAISVLTEEDFFMGSTDILKDVRKIVTKPILRKDFIFEEYQIYETRAMGADALLLIAAMLDKNQSKELIALASELSLSVLYEIHNDYELEKALSINVDIIGVNNRNLKTLQIDIITSERLASLIPKDKVKASESGIDNPSHVSKINNLGFDAILVGTAITKSKDKRAKIIELTSAQIQR
ncbi:MAG TPA: indole-3-glycerol phosphate synthase TrpC [Nitrospirae bacterium]|nr:indole-3-glycerol phosphate synthase TrpC [Nitrospirota bacterium]